MKLVDLLGETGDIRKAIEELMDPTTVRAPQEKGPDAIRVTGYVVRGHWRRRWYHANGPQAQPPQTSRRRRTT